MQEFFQILTNVEFNWSIVETIAVFFSILYVVLVVREIIWCWAAFISVSIYIYICYTTKLYPETGLQIFYLIMELG